MDSEKGKIPVTVIIFTFNEEVNIRKCLKSLKRFDEVICVDSGSSDKTKEICEKEGVEVLFNTFTGFGDQRNWALKHANTKNDWILILDADEEVTESLAEEIHAVVKSAPQNVAAFRVRRRLYVWGRWLKRSSLYPTWVVRLVKKDRVQYINRGHAETQEVKGDIGLLEKDLKDENLKPLQHWFDRQNVYALKEAQYELDQKVSLKSVIDVFSRDVLKRRKAKKAIFSNLPMRPTLYFYYAYIFRGGILEGRDGLFFCRMKSIYYSMIDAHKYDIKKTHNNCG